MTLAAIRQSQATLFAADSAKAKSVIATVFAILDRKSKIDPSNTSGLTMETVIGNIEFQHVKFCYPNRPEVIIFHDLCLSIQSGQVLYCFLLITLSLHLPMSVHIIFTFNF